MSSVPFHGQESDADRERFGRQTFLPHQEKNYKALAKQPRTLTNAHLTEVARRRGLPPPLFDWTSRFVELPSEVIETKLSFSAFHQTTRNRIRPNYTKLEKLQALPEPHMFNAVAGVSPKLNTIVENYCAFLLKKYSALQEQTASAPNSELSTHRAFWLAFIRDRPLEGSAFNHAIVCCHRCDRKHWPTPLRLSYISRSLGIPEFFVTFPPQELHLQTGIVGTDALFLGYQILKLRELVRSNKPKYVPSWMTEVPACFEDDVATELRTNWMALEIGVRKCQKWQVDGN
ncbi:uncharacterized protein PV09_00927 [Verruconis gallopava]|uniref:Uncharacterized protein n=1 Tax=Verruconis gallopava TaxID=253628 RepID=A0A0D2BCF9_9PEZI|nr:uncharacterized protein PV09_00927 [Verruconis gallopava]KIW09034.1 hypothetical protein PV09_00927 [Verruconis gallopava]